MALTTFDRELYEQGLREEGEARGEARGKEIGKEIGKAQGEENLSKLIAVLLDEGLDDVVRIVISDKGAREEYYQKYNIK